MTEKSNEKKITLTEEQASRAAETLIHAWLRNDENNTHQNKDTNNK